jgi:hypothetical protein
MLGGAYVTISPIFYLNKKIGLAECQIELLGVNAIKQYRGKLPW